MLLFRAKTFTFLLLVSLTVGASLVLGEDEELDAVEIEDEEEEFVAQPPSSIDMLDDLNLTLSSPNVWSIIKFIEPEWDVMDLKELPTNHVIRFLVGMKNLASQANESYVVDYIQASFRYAQDFSYHIQNFTALRYSKQVGAGGLVSLEYAFQVHESFAGRPFGLVILMDYHNMNGNYFTNTLYNETVLIIEEDIGFDGETLFLYILGLAIISLIGFLIWQYTGISKIKKRGVPQRAAEALKPHIELGTKSNYVDASWLPEETLRFLNKPKQGKKAVKKRSK